MDSSSLKWWQKTVIYELYVRSFYDTNEDGMGDLPGVIEKLDYLKDLGVGTIWITPIYPSSGYDSGYDVTTLSDIDPSFGTMKDFDRLIEECHKNDMYVVMDFIANHTSVDHPWFKASCKNNDPNNPYRDYYIWFPSEDKNKPPNNWISIFEKPAWTYCEERKAWYFHQFLPTQPELNYRNPMVRKDIEKIIRFWLDEKSADGLRMDAASFLVENEHFTDEPILDECYLGYKSLAYDQLQHIHTANQPETFELLVEWKHILDEIGQRTGREKFIVTEAYNDDIKTLMNYYQYKNEECCSFTFNFQLIKLFDNEDVINPIFTRESYPFNPFVLKKLIDPWIENLREGYWTNWQIGNHDTARIASRIGKANVDLANVLCLLLGGTATVYYGEEIGMENYPTTDFSFEMCKDHYGIKQGAKKYKLYTRDYQRTPMQWDSSENAGFCKPGIQPWLPVHKNHVYLNVEAQLKEKRSHLNIYKDLIKLRKEASFQVGNFKYALLTEQLFSFIRHAPNNPTFLVAMNISDEELTFNFSRECNLVPEKVEVKYYIGLPDQGEDLYDKYKIGNTIESSAVQLKARNCLILTFFI